MGLELVTAPASEPITLTEAKAQLRVTSSSEDTYISSLITAARVHIERLTGLAIITQTWRLTLDEFSDTIELPRGPVASVTSVDYLDSAGDTQTVSDTSYSVDSTSYRSRIVLNEDATWPTPLDGINVVTIEYVAGNATLPNNWSDLRFAILLLMTHWYRNREAVSEDRMYEVPLAVSALIQPYMWVIS